ncbi:MAG: cupin domain-containing protein [Paracoccaceae bacterium]
MQIYTPGTEIGVLQPWPFDNPESNYKILFGAPAASGRIDTGGAGYTTRSGIWRCTAGTFECTEQGDELMTLLSGRCHLTDQSTGKSHELGAGDSLFMPDGRRVTWEIIQEVTKVFFGNKPSGF